MPISTPIRPPVTLKSIDSMRNWLNMSIPLAPTLMRKPISRVRSVTLTYIMFIMPMPPTTKDIPAIQARSIVIRSVVEFIMLASSSCERILKSSSSASLSPVASFSLCCVRNTFEISSTALSVKPSVNAEQFML